MENFGSNSKNLEGFLRFYHFNLVFFEFWMYSILFETPIPINSNKGENKMPPDDKEEDYKLKY